MTRLIAIIALIMALLNTQAMEIRRKAEAPECSIGTPAYHEPACGIGEAAYHEPGGTEE